MKIDEKVYTRDWFHQKVIVEKLTTREIADIIGCSQPAVIKKLSKFNLKKLSDTNNKTDKLSEESKVIPSKSLQTRNPTGHRLAILLI